MDNVLDIILKTEKLKVNARLVNSILKIDPDFDFNRFSKITSINVLYNHVAQYNLPMEKISRWNYMTHSIDFEKFILKDYNEELSDINIFVRNLNNVDCLIYDGDKKFYVKYLNKNGVNFEFALSGLNYICNYDSEIQGYFYNGGIVDDPEIEKQLIRKDKFKSLIDE